MASLVVLIENVSPQSEFDRLRSLSSIPRFEELKKILKRPASEANEWAAIESLANLRGPIPLSIWKKVEDLGYWGLRDEMLEQELDRPWIGISHQEDLSDLMLCCCSEPVLGDYCKPCARARRFRMPAHQKRVDPIVRDLMRFCYRLGREHVTHQEPASQSHISTTLRHEIAAWLILHQDSIEPEEFQGYLIMLKEYGY